jgi:hypothetical protein
MIRALLDGKKTQTRQALKQKYRGILMPAHSVSNGPSGPMAHEYDRAWPVRTGYSIGNRLWLQEAWRTDIAYDDLRPSELGGEESIQYETDHALAVFFGKGPFREGRYRSSTHMPRWASRLTLAVTDVRVQRLQDISEGDAIAEGVEDVTRNVASRDPMLKFWKRYRDGGWNGYVDTAIGSYASLWTEINGPDAWAANPWVVALTFDVHRCNIDAMDAAT